MSVAVPSAPLQIRPQASDVESAGSAWAAHALSEVSKCWPEELLIHACSMPCRKVEEEESVPDAAEPASDRAELLADTASKLLGLAKSASKVSHPAGELRSPSSPVNTAGSRKSVGFTAVIAELAAEPIAKSKMSSNTSALAVGAPTSGLSPNARNATALPPRPGARARRRALA